MLNLSGIPPLFGFYTKLYLFNELLLNGYFFIVIVSILASVVSAANYISIVNVLFNFYSTDSASQKGTISRPIYIPYSIASLLSILLFIMIFPNLWG